MKKAKKIILVLCVLSVLFLMVSAGGKDSSGAADGPWRPKKPVTIVLPTNPGDYYDAQARVLGAELEKLLGQPFVMEYMPGAGQALATEYVYRADGDGYTIGYCALQPTVVNKLVYSKNYDFTKFTFLPSCYNQFNDKAFLYIPIAADPSRNGGLGNWNDVLKAGRTLRWASVGEGSVVHLTGIVLEQYYGIKLTHVLGYGGGPDCVTAVARGESDMTTMTIDVCRPFFNSGDVKPAFTIGPARSDEYPDIPSMSDDHPELVPLLANKHFLVLPPNTPQEIGQVYEEAMLTAMKSDAMKQLHVTSISNGRMYSVETGAQTLETVNNMVRLITPLLPLFKK
ncbi:MAG: tripartite tricarboxylate transporter substrate binding protein [Treponema sp.]|jgi:tripartite-type tricarboxylate transporter receptor subunit TctC|nr:tripartite tricarboxylate transporter substrate binding protein [Treponema sp.]